MPQESGKITLLQMELTKGPQFAFVLARMADFSFLGRESHDFKQNDGAWKKELCYS